MTTAEENRILRIRSIKILEECIIECETEFFLALNNRRIDKELAENDPKNQNHEFI